MAGTTVVAGLATVLVGADPASHKYVSMKRKACSSTSSSIVSMRFLVSGPVSSIFWLPSSCAQLCITPRGPNFSLNLGSLG